MAEESEVAAAIRAAVAEARAALTTHITLKELLAYHEGRLSEEEADPIQEHLTLCRPCTGLLLDLKAFPLLEPPNEEGRLSGEQLDRDWVALRQRIKADREREQEATTAQPWHAPRWLYAFAVVWLLATVGLCLWIIRLRDSVDVLSQPRINLALADLNPGDDGVRDVLEGWAVVRLALGQDSVLLVLHATEAPAAVYRAELFRDGQEPPLWTHPGLRSNADGLFSLQFSRRELPQGRYRLRLAGAVPKALEYRFVVVDEAHPVPKP